MPNRVIREGWIESQRIDSLDPQSERFFLRLCLKADDFGRYHAHPQLLKSNLFPLKDDVRSTDIPRWLAACEKAGLIRCYEVDSKAYLEILRFDQRLRAKVSKFPLPADACPSLVRHLSDESHTEAKHPQASCARRIPPLPLDSSSGVGVQREGIEIEDFPAGFPKCEADAVRIIGAGMLPDPPPPAYVAEVWNQLAARGGRDAVGRQIGRWQFYINGRWPKEKMKWQAEHKSGINGNVSLIVDETDIFEELRLKREREEAESGDEFE